MTTIQLVNYAHEHSFPAWADDDSTIHVVVPFVRRDGDGKLHTGHEVQHVPATLQDVRSVIAR